MGRTAQLAYLLTFLAGALLAQLEGIVFGQHRTHLKGLLSDREWEALGVGGCVVLALVGIAAALLVLRRTPGFVDPQVTNLGWWSLTWLALAGIPLATIAIILGVPVAGGPLLVVCFSAQFGLAGQAAPGYRVTWRGWDRLPPISPPIPWAAVHGDPADYRTPGWYPDPCYPDADRYWDGYQWTAGARHRAAVH